MYILSCFLNTTWRTPLSVWVSALLHSSSFHPLLLLLLFSTPPVHRGVPLGVVQSFSARWRSVAHNAAFLLGRIHVSWRFLSYCKHMITKRVIYYILSWQISTPLSLFITITYFLKRLLSNNPKRLRLVQTSRAEKRNRKHVTAPSALTGTRSETHEEIKTQNKHY